MNETLFVCQSYPEMKVVPGDFYIWQLMVAENLNHDIVRAARHHDDVVWEMNVAIRLGTIRKECARHGANYNQLSLPLRNTVKRAVKYLRERGYKVQLGVNIPEEEWITKG